MTGETMTAEVRCEACLGSGYWEAECCNGSGGCSCRGVAVPMGACNVCGGSGWRAADADTYANVRSIQGYCFLGSGPSSGYWAGKPAMGRR